jgi:putative ABC transport system ATP-binding protein
MNNRAVLELSHVSKIYPLGEHKVQALRKVSLTINKGDFVSIVGHSGSGKSTLMHIMGLLDTPTDGSVFLEGRNVSKLREEELASLRNQKIGFVFQEYNLLERTSALDNVGLSLLYSGVDEDSIKKRADVALISVGLADRVNHFPNQLSGGEQQRVAIARALINQPSIILADEPTGNLDSKTGDEIIRIFKKLNRDGVTVVLVTHEQDLARRAKRIIQMRDGRVLS